MSVPRHSGYKASGLQWPNLIPENWTVTPLKHVAQLKGRLGWQGLRADEYTEDGPFLVTSEHFTNDKVDWGRCYHVSFDRYELAPEIQLRPHDLLMMKDGAAMGKLAYIDQLSGPACLNSHLLLFRPKNNGFLPRFLYYVLDSSIFKTYVFQQRTGTTFFGISQESIGAFPFIVPPMGEQVAIAAFLDRETAKIDALVEEQQRLINLLREKRQVVISHAVTKGLNPDAPMKSSGVEWLGKVPEHWEVFAIKRLTVLQSGSSITAEDIEEDGAFPVFGGNGRRGYTTRFTHEGEFVLVGRQGALCGNVKYASGKFWASEHALVAHPVQSYNVFWFGELLATMNLGQYSVSAAQPGLSADVLNNLRCPVPPREEQEVLAQFIRAALRRIEPLIDEAEKAIPLLQERRAALISAAVTGKIDVRDLTEIDRAVA